MKLACTDCALSKVGCVSGEGVVGAEIFIVTDRPTLEDINNEKAYSGKTGEQLLGYLTAAGVARSNVYMTNIVKGWVKPKLNVSIVSIKKCFTYLEQEINNIKPKVIVLMGSTAYKGFQGNATAGTHYYEEKYGAWIVYTHHVLKPILSGQGQDYKEILDAFIKAKSLITTPKDNGQLKKPEVTIIRTKDELKEILPQLLQYEEYGLDTETTGLNTHLDKLLSIGLSNGKLHVGIVFQEDMLADLNMFFSKVKIIAHHIKFDLQVLRNAGLNIQHPFADSMLAHYAINPLATNHDLVSLSLKEFNTSFEKDLDYSTLFNNGITQEILDLLAVRGTYDAYLSYMLFSKYRETLDAKFNNFFYKVLMPIAGLLSELEYNGIGIDTKELFATETEIKYKLKSMEADIIALPDIQKFMAKEGLETLNLNSPKQMSSLIYSYLKLPVDKEMGKTTKKEALDKLNEKENNPILTQLLNYRNLSKLQTTYIGGIKEALERSKTDRVHVSYHQETVVTGRLSCSKPNLQTIPNEKSVENASTIRKMFCSKAGYSILELDFKQLEFRVWAHMCKDAVMLNMIQDGGDIHKKIASNVFKVSETEVTDKQRYQAKEVSFGLMYGMGVNALSARTKISLEEAIKVKKDFFETFPEATTWLTQVADFAIKNKFVSTLFGRRIPIIFNPNEEEDISKAKRHAVNYPIQSTAAELTNMVGVKMLQKVKAKGMDTQIILNVHDSLIWEVREGLELELKQIAVDSIKELVDELKFRAVLEASFKIGKNLDEQTPI